MYKVANGSCSLILNEIFKLRDQCTYNILHQNTFKMSLVNIICNGEETVAFLAPKI